MQDCAEPAQNGTELRSLANEHDNPSQSKVDRPGGIFAAMHNECVLAQNRVREALKNQWEFQEKLVDFLLEEQRQQRLTCNGHSPVTQKCVQNASPGMAVKVDFLEKQSTEHVIRLDQEEQEMEHQRSATSSRGSETREPSDALAVPKEMERQRSAASSRSSQSREPSDALAVPKEMERQRSPASSHSSQTREHADTSLPVPPAFPDVNAPGQPSDHVSVVRKRASFAQDRSLTFMSQFSPEPDADAEPHARGRRKSEFITSRASRASRKSVARVHTDSGIIARGRRAIKGNSIKDFDLADVKEHTNRKCIVEQFLEKKKGDPELPGTWQERLMLKVDRWSLSWVEMQEPDRTGCVANLVLSSKFSCVFAMVIFVDAICAAYAADYGMHHATAETSDFTKVIEIAALFLYISEFVLKLMVHRCYYFANEDWAWNIFDMILVLQATFDAFLTYLASADAGNITFMKLLRLLKLAKILRLFRAVRMLTELRIIFASITNSFMGLFWTFVTLALILYIFSLMFVQGLTGYLIDHKDDPDQRLSEDIRYYFGSVRIAALTLYTCTSGGVNWHDIYVIVSQGGAITTIQFIFFIGFFNFALLNILTGIFMEKALQAAQPERETMLLEQRRAEEKEVYGLMEVFKRMDLDGSGTLTHEEYLDGARDKNVQAYLKGLGLNTESAEMFFRVLEQMTGSGEVPVADFVEGCGRMKGYATAMDVQVLFYQMKSVKDVLVDVLSRLPSVEAVESEPPQSPLLT